MKKVTIITTAVISLALLGTGFLTIKHFTNTKSNKRTGVTTTTSSGVTNSENKNSSDFTYIPPKTKGIPNKAKIKKIENAFKPNRTLNLNRNSVTLLINKEYTLPKDYVPKDLVVPNVNFDIVGNDERKLMRKEAANALENLFSAAANQGYYFTGVSAYRSYNRQYQIFINNIVTKGKDHTLKYSAVPGTSEHQSGLSIDITSRALKDRLDTVFANTPEGIWLARNAKDYGFIIRYPKDKENITGYAYEPWHIRYVGIGLANYLYKNNMTLDEYYRYKPSIGFDFEAMYASMINYRPTPTPTHIPLPTFTPTPSPSPAPSPTKAPKITVTPTPGAENDGENITPTMTPGITPETVSPNSENNNSGNTANAGNTEMSN